MIIFNKSKSIKTKLFLSYFILFIAFLIAIGIVSFSTFNRPVEESHITTTIIIVSFAIIGFFLSSHIAVVLSAPIIQLRDAFESAAKGNLYAISTVKTKDEIGETSNSFNSMMQQFRIMTYYDSLTQLSNYKYFVEQLDMLIDLTSETDDSVAVVRIGIDRFRTYNNALGVNSGDEILKIIANLIETSIGSKSYLSRVAGDEFAFILTGKGLTKKAISLVHYINSQLEKGIMLNSNNIYITVSSGISVYPEHGLTSENLISNSGIAMTISKSSRLGGCQVYKEEQGALSSKYVAISNDIKAGISNNEFHLVYQPIKDVISGNYTSMETLVRWNHKDLGPLSPDLFIKLAEENGMIIDLGYWILENAIKDFSEMLTVLEEPLSLAINISPLQLVSTNFTKNLFTIIRNCGVDPHLVVLEITERILIDSNYEISSILHKIKDFGCKISLDDFGTGYSSLNYLYKYPFDIMKIDKSFIDDILNNNTKQNLVRSMIQIAGSMNFKTVAEGVESKEQADFLSLVGCNKIQGYYYTKPLDIVDVKSFLGTHNTSVILNENINLLIS